MSIQRLLSFFLIFSFIAAIPLVHADDSDAYIDAWKREDVIQQAKRDAWKQQQIRDDAARQRARDDAARQDYYRR